jgi:hypothetical protein
MQPTGEQVWNEETMEMDAVLAEVITVSAIEPLEATVTRWVYSDDMEAAPTEETIENPLITADNAERVAAQAVIDATPEAVHRIYTLVEFNHYAIFPILHSSRRQMDAHRRSVCPHYRRSSVGN